MKYRKKPIVIEAYQTDTELDIETLEGTMHASIGDYIITGINGEKYPCKPDIFEKTYELVKENNYKTNKELTPLEAWGKVKEYLEYCLEIRDGCEAMMWNSTYGFLKPFIDNVEAALEEKEILTETFEQFVGETSEVIYKKLKALEIIKNLLSIKLEKTDNGECFIYSINHNLTEITQDQYDLLREVLL